MSEPNRPLSVGGPQLLSPSPSPTWPGSRPTGAKISFISQSLDPHPSDGDSVSLGSEADELEAHLDTVSIRDSDLPNPWIDNPAPTSEIYPTIIYQLKYFVNSLKTMRDPRRIWPYRRNPGDEKKVLFFDFRGYGPPPHDIGNPGDFYLDHTHKDSSRYLMYVREEDGWVCSNWSADPKRKEFKLHKHPLLKDRYLWGTEASGFMWFTGDNVRKLGCYRLRDEHDPTSMIEQALSYNFYWQKLTDAQERENAEIKRRSELRIAWELENIPPTPEDIKRKEAEREKRRQYEAESQRKLEERNRRRLSALHHEEEEAGPSALTEQELTLVVPVDQGVLITNGTGVKLEELRDLPIPAKRRRKVVKARNGSQSSSDDDDESPETKRQCLDARRRASGPTNSGVLPPTFGGLSRCFLQREGCDSRGGDQNSEDRKDGGRARDSSRGSEDKSSDFDSSGDGAEFRDVDRGGEYSDLEDFIDELRREIRENQSESDGDGDEGDLDGDEEEEGNEEEDKADEEGDGDAEEKGAEEEEEENEDSDDSEGCEEPFVPVKRRKEGASAKSTGDEMEGLNTDDEMIVDAEAEGAALHAIGLPTSTAPGSSTMGEATTVLTSEPTPYLVRDHAHVPDPMVIDEYVDNPESITQKAADVHAFLLKRAVIENNSKARAEQLTDALQKEKEARFSEEKRLSDALQKEKDARFAEEQRLNMMLNVERQKYQGVAVELEKTKQTMDADKKEKADLTKALQDMTRQRDEAIAGRQKSDHAFANAETKLAKMKDLFNEGQQTLGGP